MKVNVFVKKLGKNRINRTPLCFEYADDIHTVRDLLKETVRIQIEAYQKGQKDTELGRLFSPTEQESLADTGKIGFGIHYNTNKPDPAKAIETAWLCFEDGIVAVFADGEKLESLDAPVNLKDESELVFIRMTMLAGRMW